jgi:hypothetical protein
VISEKLKVKNRIKGLIPLVRGGNEADGVFVSRAKDPVPELEKYQKVTCHSELDSESKTQFDFIKVICQTKNSN